MVDEFDRADVAIVGFGPVGAALAGLLGQRGLSVIVLEREWDVFALPRAAHIDHTGVRILQELGLIDELLPTMLQNDGLEFVTAEGETLIHVPGNQTSVSGIPASMYFHQPDLDRRVRRKVSSLESVDVRLGTEVVGLQETEEQVRVDLLRPDGSLGSVEASWVVGCDGSWSQVREETHLALEDFEFEEQWLVVDLVLTGAADAIATKAVCYCDPARPTYSIPMPARRHRFEFMLMPDESGSHMQARVPELVTPYLSAVEYEVERSAVYTFHGLVASDWRRGRVMIAGDSAHQMPPFLGQGMCSGLRDASNLAWKLERVVRSSAPDSLLDTYQVERSAHVRGIVEAAISFGRLICTVDRVEAARRDADMLAHPKDALNRMPFNLPSLVPSELVLDGGGQLFVQPYGEGRRLDDVVGTRFAVFARTENTLQGSRSWWESNIDAFVATLDELGPFERAIRGWLDTNLADAVVVRPDRYVMWAGEDLTLPADTLSDQLAVDLLVSDSGEPSVVVGPGLS